MENQVESPATILPKIKFGLRESGNVNTEYVEVVDRHGEDLTSRLCVCRAAFELRVNRGYAVATLVIPKRDWLVDDSENRSNDIEITHVDGYDLVDGLEPNSVKTLYPRDSTPRLEITFDAEWA